jgi:S1-C subfamily serine protease
MKQFAATVVMMVVAAGGWILADDMPDLDSSVVRVTVTSQESDPFLPWQNRRPGLRQGYGVVVGPSLVVTTENLVRNHALVQVRKAGTGREILANVVLSDCEADVALLRIDDAEEDPGFVPLDLTDKVLRDAQVEIIQFDETSQVQKGKAEVVQIVVEQLPVAPFESLVFSLLTDLNVNGEGAVVLHDGKLAGLMISYDNSSRTGSMLPYSIIRRFLEDAEKQPYPGFASAGFSWSYLVDPVKRRYLNVADNGEGVLVLACLPDSGAFEVLRSNDVIMEWDGCVIDNLGFYEDVDFGRLAFPYLIKGKREAGEEVPVRIIRDGKEQQVTVRLSNRLDSSYLIPENVTNERPEYVVEGGLVIRELTGRYLKAYGSEWYRRVDSRLVHLYMTSKYSPEKPGDRTVILSHVLPDVINIGYQQFADDIITKLNGEEVSNMSDVFRIVDRDGHIERVTVRSVEVDLVLDGSELDAANRRIARIYRLPRLEYRRGERVRDKGGSGSGE